MAKTSSSQLPKLEIILGIVSPLGTKKNIFEEKIRNHFETNNIRVEPISVADELINILPDANFSRSFKYYIKMQICSKLREKSNSILVETILNSIKKIRKTVDKYETVVYLIDQLKHVSEYKVLSHIYGLNYLQISLFSSETERDHYLEEIFEKDVDIEKKYDVESLTKSVIKNIKVKNGSILKYIKRSKIKYWIEDYIKVILSDSSHMLILKDFVEIDSELIESNSGQQVFDLFHRSHYFVNLDMPIDGVESEVEKFVKLLLGKYREFPLQDEFGMCLAYQASVRSNFPGDRQIGASIISEQGEVISVASIRAPSKSSNTTLQDKNKVKPGYDKYYKNIKSWRDFISSLEKSKSRNGSQKSKMTTKEISALNDISDFIKGILDFHPCTHAEISAIIDAAKLGVSVRGATLYTTTFPCHLCAKDIINSGISRVVYLEAYPKSKNKDLYPYLIDFDTNVKSEKIPFNFYCGVGPKRFLYAYSSENNSTTTNGQIPLLRFELPKYYEVKEKDVLNHFKKIFGTGCSNSQQLCDLLHGQLRKLK